MNTTRSLTVGAMLLVLFCAVNDAYGQVYCDPDDIDGTVACGDTIAFRADLSGFQSLFFTFAAAEGDVFLFSAQAPLFPEASIMIWVAAGDCTIKFVQDPPDPGASAKICPFTAPESGVYVLGIQIYGRRGPLYTVRMECLDPDNLDCGSVPAGAPTWGSIKVLYQ